MKITMRAHAGFKRNPYLRNIKGAKTGREKQKAALVFSIANQLCHPSNVKVKLQ